MITVLRINKKHAYISAVILFLTIRLIAFDFFVVITLFLMLFYFIGLYCYVMPYIYGENINIPGYAHNLIKGEDDLLRAISFSGGILLCLAALFGPVVNI